MTTSPDIFLYRIEYIDKLHLFNTAKKRDCTGEDKI